MLILALRNSGWAVDQAVIGELDRLVVIRFGQDDQNCQQMDLALASIAGAVHEKAVIFAVDTSEVYCQLIH